MKAAKTPLENILINSKKEKMLKYIRTHPTDFKELIDLALSNQQPFSWRAAWLLHNCMDKNDLRIHAYVSTIIDRLTMFSDGHQRNLLNILLKMEVPEENEGLLYDSSVKIWLDLKKQSSVRSKAFEVIFQLAMRYPELRQEVSAMTDKRFVDALSAGIRKSVQRKIGEMKG
ncbi:hypothetical protein CW751_13790 [Brumimicrobium salinarum]|uniref:Uncharacterized protein n=1 Tax=Brumimicrobium salinarum TaxID=2058658 RepID=A0A2I0QZE3_9FLAO|nr:hypothetical protein [Brumimicrobium salinarum]PKR79704.1 hypothetical protein CW751_13790 [Brumimicrobium salinarum]